MPQAWELSEPLDKYLWEVIQTLNAAVDQGIRTLESDTAATGKAIKDCEEILDVILEGDVQEWVGA